MMLTFRSISFLVISGYMSVLAIGGCKLAFAQSDRALTVIADSQSANTDTGVIVAEGNVTIRYPSEQLVGQSHKATYFTQEQRIVMEGAVDVTQGDNRLQAETVIYLLEDNTLEALPIAGGQVQSVYVFPDEEDEGATTPEATASEPSTVETGEEEE